LQAVEGERFLLSCRWTTEQHGRESEGSRKERAGKSKGQGFGGVSAHSVHESEGKLRKSGVAQAIPTRAVQEENRALRARA
jgi:hypothetical protein